MASWKRRHLTLEERVNALKKLDDGGISCRQLAVDLKCGKTQIARLKTNREAIMREWDRGRRSTKIVQRRKSTYHALNTKMFEFFSAARAKNLPVTGRIIQEKALSEAATMGFEGFTASNGWLQSWQRQFNISFAAQRGESASVPEIAVVEAAVENWIKPEIIEENSTTPGNNIGINELQATVIEIIPPLTSSLHKGQAGRIGIIGGCQEYTGAPYFAAISALKVGGDLSHVFCTKDAATVIKCYSPELIVLPILDHPTALVEFDKWLPRLHTLVVGPGLGQDQQVLETVAAVIIKAKSRGIPLVIDADGLFLITERPELITNYQYTLLTPNITEFQKLFEKMVGDRPCQTDELSKVKLLSQCLGNVTVLRKGSDDIISDGSTVIMCSTEGSPRRCGSQGDLLCGATSVFFNWALCYHNSKSKLNQQKSDTILGPGVLAAFMACRLIRETSRLAFAMHGRSMTAIDMLVNIHSAFEGVFSN